MASLVPPPRRPRWAVAFLAGALAALPAVPGAADARQKVDELRIGSSGNLAADDKGKEKAALESLESFVKEETGFNNDIQKQKDWAQLAERMAKGQLHLGVFRGYEFAWAKKKYPDLKPLAVAINVYRYPVAYVIVRRDAAAKTFNDLRGKPLGMPSGSTGFLDLFVERQAAGKKPDAFFSKITREQTSEDALDDVVDGVVQAAAVDRAALEAYKRRKPGRFKQLKPVAESKPFPPAVVAYYGKVLDDDTLRRFRDGLLGAAQKERGQTMLTMFRLTGFETVPDDFEKVLADTRKEYPPPDAKAE